MSKPKPPLTDAEVEALFNHRIGLPSRRLKELRVYARLRPQLVAAPRDHVAIFRNDYREEFIAACAASGDTRFAAVVRWSARKALEQL